MNQQTYSQTSQAYTRASHTVGKTRQVVMLYDGIIRFLNQAAEAIEQKQIEKRYQKLTRATDVITGLQASLDFKLGGQPAQLLHDFYSSIESRIFSLHAKPDLSVCQQLVRELKDMRDVWDQIDRGGANEAAKTAAPLAVPVTPAELAGSVKVSA